MDTLYDDVEINVNVAPPVMNYQDKEVFALSCDPANGLSALSYLSLSSHLKIICRGLS